MQGVWQICFRQMAKYKAKMQLVQLNCSVVRIPVPFAKYNASASNCAHVAVPFTSKEGTLQPFVQHQVLTKYDFMDVKVHLQLFTPKKCYSMGHFIHQHTKALTVRT